MSYQPPKHILEVLQQIEFEDALRADDERYVDTSEARGSQNTLGRLARKFGLQLPDGPFVPPTSRHVLFFGHIGSGKTTELRRYAKDFGGPERYFVVEVDITSELDRNNVQYADVLMTMARALLSKIDRHGVHLGTDVLEELEQWFTERVLTTDEAKDFSSELKADAKAKGGLPWLLELFGQFTAAFKANVTYKDSLRRVIRNSFTQFAEAFNRLLRWAETALAAAGLGQRLLFMIDGTDKLRSEDTRRFFIEDAEQLLTIEGHVVYTAPLNLKYEVGLVGRLQSDIVLPMIKLYERDGVRCEAGWRALRALLLKRADAALFAGDAEIERLIEHCGGHPRELLRLLGLCCEFAEEDRIDASTVELAIRQLASEYRRFLEPGDYALLARLDADPLHGGNDERTRKLLYNLVLLEYNDGSWRRTHPVVRTLEGYRRATEALPGQASG